MLKRSMDIALAGLLLLFTFPILALAALVIVADTRGPVFFCQARMGRGGRPFLLFKLRTMRVGQAGSQLTLGPDPRITAAGGWLRRLKIDELPQLLNVVRGEMSLVGPRPVIPELACEFERAYRSLLKVRPGLTDPATLKYCREAEILARTSDPLRYFKTVITPDKLRISRAYLLRANPGSDLIVLTRTALALLATLWRTEQGVRTGSWNHRAAMVRLAPAPVRRRRPLIALDGAAVAGPFELPACLEDASGRRGLRAAGQLAYRHLESASGLSTLNREWS